MLWVCFGEYVVDFGKRQDAKKEIERRQCSVSWEHDNLRNSTVSFHGCSKVLFVSFKWKADDACPVVE